MPNLLVRTSHLLLDQSLPGLQTKQRAHGRKGAESMTKRQTPLARRGAQCNSPNLSHPPHLLCFSPLPPPGKNCCLPPAEPTLLLTAPLSHPPGRAAAQAKTQPGLTDRADRFSPPPTHQTTLRVLARKAKHPMAHANPNAWIWHCPPPTPRCANN